jgi:hypothetical protein
MGKYLDCAGWPVLHWQSQVFALDYILAVARILKVVVHSDH